MCIRDRPYSGPLCTRKLKFCLRFPYRFSIYPVSYTHLGFINYTVIWRYFSWTNQTLAMIVLWAASMYLFQEKKNYWITAVPATFMSAVSSTYFVLAPECLGSILNSKTAEGATIYNTAVAYPFGVIFAVAMLAIFLHATKKNTQKKAA